MKKLTLALLLCFTPLMVEAKPLKIVSVNEDKINCLFNLSCTVTPTDTSEEIHLTTGGTGLLRVRTFSGAPGSPTEGLFVYEYRIDMSNALAESAISCIDLMNFNFGPVVSNLDLNGDTQLDQLFVVTSGAGGAIGIAEAAQSGSILQLKFTGPICAGMRAGRGDSTFFWGMISRTPPRSMTASLRESTGAMHKIKLQVPK